MISPCKSAKIALLDLSTDWAIIAPGRDEADPQFVNEDMLFLAGNPVRLLRTNGQVIFNQDQSPESEGLTWGEATVSSSDARLVVPGYRTEGGSAAFDISGHSVLKRVLVYDLSSHGKPYILDVKTPKIKGITQLALSPNGSYLAILNNETVQVFDFPHLE